MLIDKDERAVKWLRLPMWTSRLGLLTMSNSTDFEISLLPG
jgi:hypothetical protein